MAKVGRKTVFHGSFTSKARARRKEHAGPGRFIQRVKIKRGPSRGQSRWLVRSRKRG